MRTFRSLKLRALMVVVICISINPPLNGAATPEILFSMVQLHLLTFQKIILLLSPEFPLVRLPIFFPFGALNCSFQMRAFPKLFFSSFFSHFFSFLSSALFLPVGCQNSFFFLLMVWLHLFWTPPSARCLLPFLLSQSTVPLISPLDSTNMEKPLTSPKRAHNLPRQSSMIKTNLAFIPSLYTSNIFFSPAKTSFGKFLENNSP